MDRIDQIIAVIEHFQDPEDPPSLKILDQALIDLFQSPHPERGIEAMLGVFERFPEHDGNGVFWSILHGLEALPDYEPRLVLSVRRSPGEFNLMMVTRILNSGETHVGRVSLLALLEEIAADPRHPAKAREYARDTAAPLRERRGLVS